MDTNNDTLKTDLYELTMAAGYFENGFNATASFEVYVYGALKSRNFLIACGIEQCLEYVKGLRFSSGDIKFLKSHPMFKNVSRGFFDYLKGFRFSGDIYALPEGSAVFGNEPILRVTAPIIEAQILETYLLSTINLQTMVASKAARVVNAASCDGAKRGVVDFGSRRAHGPDAAVYAARASYIGGCIGTSNVYAGRRFGIPVFGTMAHSWIQAFDSEDESYRRYVNTFGKNSVLLIDTYDTVKAAARLSRFKNLKAVRLDSGDLLSLSRKVRSILDKAGMKGVMIMASGSLDEYKIEKLVKSKAAIDLFGVGTNMVTSSDEPSLNVVYKLVSIQRGSSVINKAKFSSKKVTYPGKKQVFRKIGPKGMFMEDIIDLDTAGYGKGYTLLLKKAVEKGRFKDIADTKAARYKAISDINALAPSLRRLNAVKPYDVKVSRSLVKQLEGLRQKIIPCL